jgi:hypothetical protein
MSNNISDQISDRLSIAFWIGGHNADIGDIEILCSEDSTSARNDAGLR